MLVKTLYTVLRYKCSTNCIYCYYYYYDDNYDDAADFPLREVFYTF